MGAWAAFWWTGTTRKGHKVYGVAPDGKTAQAWGIPADAVTFVVRKDGTGRVRVYEGDKEDLDTSKVQDMDGKIMSFRGQEAPFKWRQRARRAVAELVAEQVAAITGGEA